MAWVEDTWGVIASPTAVSATVKGAKRQVVALDMGLGRLFQVNLKLPSAHLAPARRRQRLGDRGRGRGEARPAAGRRAVRHQGRGA